MLHDKHSSMQCICPCRGATSSPGYGRFLQRLQHCHANVRVSTPRLLFQNRMWYRIFSMIAEIMLKREAGTKQAGHGPKAEEGNTVNAKTFSFDSYVLHIPRTRLWQEVGSVAKPWCPSQRLVPPPAIMESCMQQQLTQCRQQAW